MEQQNEIEKGPVSSLAFNYKRAVTQMLILKVLSQRECYIVEMIKMIHERSNDVVNIVFPYASFSKLQSEGYIDEGEKRKAPDGRLRQYYKITDKGLHLLQYQVDTYCLFSSAVNHVLQDTSEKE